MYHFEIVLRINFVFTKHTIFYNVYYYLPKMPRNIKLN